VPLEVRAAFGGRREVSVSLRTESLSEARHRLADQDRLFESMLALALARPDPTTPDPRRPRRPSNDDIDEAVRDWLALRIADERARQFGSLDATVDHAGDFSVYAAQVASGIRSDNPELQTAWIADHLIHRHGWAIASESVDWKRLTRRVARAQIELNRRVQIEVGFSTDQPADEVFGAARYADDAKRRVAGRFSSNISLLKLFEAYAEEAKPKPATEKAWKHCLQNLIRHLGHDDASMVTPHDIVAWKESLLNETENGHPKRGGRTVRDKYLAAAKTVFGWAARNLKIPSNPTAGVDVRVRPPQRLRESGLSDDEAALILSASLAVETSSAFPHQAFARRWVPWLCAYTGARVGEMTQLRREDVRQEKEVWCVRITPEAGSQKVDRAYLVPLHPHLIEQGFLAAIDGRKGPLFYDPSRYRGGSDGNPQSKKVAERLATWVRSIGVTDLTVQPNHGWRHRFKTQARLVGMDHEARDALQGHVGRTEAQKYGDMPISVLANAIGKLPRYDLPEQNRK
jgi:integrase